MKGKYLIQLFLGVIAVFVGVGGTWYARNAYLHSVTVVSLPVPIADIPPYTVLSPAHFALREFPRALIEGQSDYVVEPKDLTGQIAASTLVAGLPVPVRLVERPADFRLADPSLEVISIPVSPENAVGGQVRIGEMINVYRLESWQIQQKEITTANTVTAIAGGVPQAQEPSATPGAPLTFTEVEWIATVRVVDVLSKDGTDATTAKTGASNAAPPAQQSQGAQPQEERAAPLQILVVAAPHEVVQKILDALAATEVGTNQLWITLATP